MKRFVFALLIVFALVAVVSADTAILYTSNATDAELAGYASSWANTGSDGTRSPNDAAYCRVGVDSPTGTPSWYQIERCALIFDTSIIPEDNVVSAGIIGFKKATGYGTYTDWGDLGITAVAYSPTVLDTGAFNHHFSFATLSSNSTLSSLSDTVYTNLTLNAAGVATISTTGSTGFGIMSDMDQNNAPHAWEAAKATHTSLSQSEGGKPAFLQVTYAAVPPVTNFVCTPTSATSPGSTSCTDTTSYAPITWAWYIWGNTTAASFSQNPTFSDLPAGTYNFRLYTTNGHGGDWENKTGYVTINQPVAAFTTSNTTSGASPLAITFSSAASTGTPTSWQWYWFANETVSNTTQNPSTTFTIGTYNVRLKTTNAVGDTDWENKTAYITSLPGSAPFATFIGIPTTGTPGLLVSFSQTGSSYGTLSTATCNWSFGDITSAQPFSSTCGDTQHVYVFRDIFNKFHYHQR
jgi:PKD repeat protein